MAKTRASRLSQQRHSSPRSSGKPLWVRLVALPDAEYFVCDLRDQIYLPR